MREPNWNDWSGSNPKSGCSLLHRRVKISLVLDETGIEGIEIGEGWIFHELVCMKVVDWEKKPWRKASKTCLDRI